MTVTASRVEITPEIAKEWLEKSKGNRSIRRGNVEPIKADIRAGDWKYNGDRIRFLPDGTLYDGHHRLTACFESGMTIVSDTFVMDYDAKPTVDKGVSRSTADLMAMEHGVSPQKSKDVAAAIRMMTMHDNTNSSDWARVTSKVYGAEFLTEHALQRYYLTNKDDIDEAADWVHEHVKRQNTLISKSQAISFLCLASRRYGKTNAYGYLYSVVTGYGIDPGSTADHIRNALLAVKMKQRKMATSHKLYSIIKGFKSIMAGRTIKHPHNAVYRPSAEPAQRL